MTIDSSFAQPLSQTKTEIPNTPYPTAGLGLVLGINGRLPPGVYGVGLDGPSGTELVYNEFVSDVSIVGTTEGTATVIVTADSYTFDGQTKVLIEFFSAAVKVGTSNVSVRLFEDGAAIGQFGYQDTASGKYVPMRVVRKHTPTLGSHVYSVRGMVDAGTGSAAAGAGGAGVNVPGFIRITKA